MTEALPIDAVLPEILDRLRASNRLILQADPGAGKTTKVPLAILQSDVSQRDAKVLMLEPRRVAARAAASYMAASLNEDVGQTVGYRIRFENRTTDATRIEVLTQGLLTRRIQQDPELSGVGVVIFDEFHERHLATDLGLALALDVQASLRPDLKILLMSATIDAERIGEFLDADVVRSEGRTYPVEIRNHSARRDEKIEHQVARCVREAIKDYEGDVLVFLPGISAIRKVERALQNESFEVLTLHGEMNIDAQSQILTAHDAQQRRVILATNVAESSVTLPNVRIVIDSGLANEPRFDAQTGLTSLKTVLISQASADQRSGRAGRTAPGVAYWLWASSQRLDKQRRAEITQTDLSHFAMEVAAWGSDNLQFLDAPPRGTLQRAQDQLHALGFVDTDHKLTAHGRDALNLGLDARLAKIVLAAPNDIDVSGILATLESPRQLRMDSDAWATRYEEAQRSNAQFRKQWQRRLRSANKQPPNDLAALIAPGYLDWVAKQSSKDPLRYHLHNGNTAQLHEQSNLYGHEYLLITELTHDRPHARIRSAIPIDEAFLNAYFPEEWTQKNESTFNPDTETMTTATVERFGKIEISRRPAQHADKEAMADALLDYLITQDFKPLPFNETTEKFLLRIRCLQHWQPNDWKRFDTQALKHDATQWLRPLLEGKSKIKSIDSQQLDQAIRNRLEWNQQQQLNAQVPTHINVPSGLDRPIEYQFDEEWLDESGERVPHAHPPILKVKLQELFGLAETPRIANGTQPLMLHLLSPGGKPLQVTQDLRSFWDNTYPEVRKEMKGRYPKHPWPEDPWNAPATHRAKPRGT